MCIVLATTAHPSYALIVIDNRDEFILRPTSRPHWWESHHQDILSARDQQRAEQGTWLGITKAGNFAVLTNFRETDTTDAEHPVQGQRSRGGMVTAWLTAPREESTTDFVHRLLGGTGVKGVGGFSLLCGKFRKHRDNPKELEPLAIVSNRSGTADDVPWIAKQRGEVYGLSNTSYADPITWPKVAKGKEILQSTVADAVKDALGEEKLIKKLFSVLDTNTLPARDGEDFESYIYQLRKSIFIPSIGDPEPQSVLPKADEIAAAGDTTLSSSDNFVRDLEDEETPYPETKAAMTGSYGTQRQTILLLDWQGKVTFIERALWEADGKPIPRGKGDMKFEFQVEGWNDDEYSGHGVHAEPHI